MLSIAPLLAILLAAGIVVAGTAAVLAVIVLIAVWRSL